MKSYSMTFISGTLSVLLTQDVARYKTFFFDDFLHFKWKGTVLCADVPLDVEKYL